MLVKIAAFSRAKLSTPRLIGTSVPPQTAMVSRPVLQEEVVAVPNTFLDRTLLTADITISKIFPGGFGWQAASVIASNAGFKATDVVFAVSTGIGDMLGVALGHLVFSSIKSVFTGAKVSAEIPVATWLGAAAFCSGTFWQPSVNFFTGLGLHFPAVFLCVGAVCVTAFFAGLRLGRIALKDHGIAAPNSHNLSEDAGLSVAIGGAAATFVSTDVTIPKNALDALFGVYPHMSSLERCVRAGASTATGFAVLHSVQNTRASENAVYLTRDTFVDVSTAIADELVRGSPNTKAAVQSFLDKNIEDVFDRFDKNGDGRLTQQELHEQSYALRVYIEKMKAATSSKLSDSI